MSISVGAMVLKEIAQREYKKEQNLGPRPEAHKLFFVCLFVFKVCVCACSIAQLSDSLRPLGLQPARLLCLWDFPGKNTGVGCHFLLQGIFPIQGSNLCLLQLLLWQTDSLPWSHLESPHWGLGLKYMNLLRWDPNIQSIIASLMVTFPEISIQTVLVWRSCNVQRDQGKGKGNFICIAIAFLLLRL